MASVIAMLFLVLFSSLAVGFYEATALSSQVAGNESAIDQARDAAESGMHFMRYQLGAISLAASPSGLMDALATQLGKQLDGSLNMAGHTVANTNGTIYLPAANQWIALDATLNSKFRATITQSGTSLVVTVTGCGRKGSIQKAIQLQFQQVPLATNVFSYGVASASEITMSSNVTITGTPASVGSVMTATNGPTALTMNGSPAISGDYSYANPAAANNYGSGTIAGFNSSSPNFSQHVHSGTAAPVFPAVDPSVWSQFATNPYVPGNKTLVNVTLPPGNYSFSGATIQGVLYVQSPSKISISGQTTIQGVIVTDCKANVGSLSTNQISMSGQVSVQDMSTLPATFPAAERAMTGAFILAPYYSLSMSGNFGSINGSMVASAYSMSGNASATISGSMINVSDSTMDFSGNGTIIIQHNGPFVPAGVYAGCKFAASQGSYLEVTPP
jgi:hypothetical protein